MNSPVLTSSRIEQAYKLAICLYPVRFRDGYAGSMIQALRDALADPDLPRLALLRTLATDLIRSLIKENLAMLLETASRPLLLFNALILVALSGMAADMASRLARGESPAAVIPNDQIDMDASLSPFVIAFNEQGQVLASSAQLNRTVPLLPRGVLDYVRTHGEERVTWAPQRGVRIASIVRHVAGPQGGFLLAGRNLREIEVRKSQVMQMAALVWLGLLGIIVVGTFLFGWLTRAPNAVPA